nr:MAG TPA: hypothetical protein [Caudoviricetes sp.]
MKNRCIINKIDDIINCICIGENDSVVATNSSYEIILYLAHCDAMYRLRMFSAEEKEIKDQLYNRLCYFLQYGKVSIINNHGESYSINTFDVEQQIDDIKKILNK